MNMLQFQEIMDKSEGKDTLDVIVQMKASPVEEQIMEELSAKTSQIERFRSTIVDPRELLPAKKESIVKTRTRAPRGNQGSFASQVFGVGKKGQLFLDENTSFKQDAFLSSDVVNKSVIQSKRKQPSKLRNANSVLFTVSRDNLSKIVTEKRDDIGGIYENKKIETPAVSKSAKPSMGIGSSRYSSQSWGVHSCGASAVWGTYGQKGKDITSGLAVKVAVLDTGIDASHPDLLGRVTSWAEFDRNGNTVSGSSAHDSATHGTHVAGSIAGGKSSGQWVGVAPECEIMGGLVLNRGSGTVAQILAGMDWAIQNGADIINMSLGDLQFDAQLLTPYRRQLMAALMQGTLVVGAIGNNGLNTSGQPGADIYTLGVGAHDVEFRCAGFSGGKVHQQGDFVYQKPDLSAPGVGIFSCVPNERHDSYNGTSMATPHVAGCAALLLAEMDMNGIPSDQRAFLLRDILEATVRPYGEMGKDQRYGFGLLDVHRAIDAAKELGY